MRNCNIYSNVFDINGKNIKVGDTVKFWKFIAIHSNSVDYFGTEPENSFPVYEEYMDFVKGEVIYDSGAFCIKYKDEVITLWDIIKKTAIDFEMYYIAEYGGEINFENEDFWGEEFEDNNLYEIPDIDSTDETTVRWDRIKNHINKKCIEFEIVLEQTKEKIETMSISLNVLAYISAENLELKKHYEAVKFCIERNLTFPKETSEFFKGKIEKNNLEYFNEDYILNYINQGIKMPIKTSYNPYGDETIIKVSDIPKEAEQIIITYS